MTTHKALSFAVCLSLALGTGCVTSGTHEKKLTELKQALEREAALKGDVDRLDGEVQKMRAERDSLQKKLDDQTALVGDLSGRLEKLGQNVDKLASERGQLQAGLEDAKARLEELRKQKAAAEARAATFRTLVDKLRSMIDAGQIKVTIRNGRMLIALPNDVLFDSGKTALKKEGQDALARIAQVLAGMPKDRRFLVAGHTDNLPIKTARFPSNWELSTARAVEVAHLLIKSGMSPDVVGAAGYAEFDPVGANETPEQRALNRRIEIVLEPNLSDLPNLDNVLQSARK